MHTNLSLTVNATLFSAETVEDFGRTMVVAPHPDDESLGCGGLLALLAAKHIAARVIVVTDGTLSHPNSRKFHQTALRELRERETCSALSELGLTAHDAVTFLRLPDRGVSSLDEAASRAALRRCQMEIAKFNPQTIFVSWRRDSHTDHRAAWLLVKAACDGLKIQPRLIEYPIWIWALNDGDDAPRAGEMRAWRLDITEVLERKQAAIRAHQSQVGDLIDDDPTGFRLSPEMLDNFKHTWELFLETAT